MSSIVHDKAWLAQALHVSDKTLHIVVGLALFLLLLKFTRNPRLAILGVFIIESINEINDTIVAYPDLSRVFWLDTSTDILATIMLPCLITGWLIFRRRPSMGSI